MGGMNFWQCSPAVQKVETGKAKKKQKSKEAESGGDLGSVRIASVSTDTTVS